MLRYYLAAAGTLPLLPILYYQGKRIQAAVPTLPEAQEPQGQVPGQSDKVLRLLCLGESTIAGVGVATHAEGFTGALARTLGARLRTQVQWRVYARSGFTLRRVRKELLPLIEETETDLVVIGTGGNDAFKLTNPSTFRKEAIATINDLRNRFGADTPIAFPNMPPIKEFPAFTPLIKATIGNLVEFHGEQLAKVVRNYPDVYFNEEIIRLKYWAKALKMEEDPTAFFSDGVHPSGLTYQVWGDDFGQFLVREGAFSG
ncbi:MAG: SGNH/GDSL hydrolase family protein [Bacteroidota bacterium]